MSSQPLMSSRTGRSVVTLRWKVLPLGHRGRRSRKPILAIVAVLAALSMTFLGGCSGDGPAGPDRDRLESNRELWRSQGASDYRYVYQATCFCIQEAVIPVEIQVTDGSIVSVTAVETGEPADPAFFSGDLTIDGLFATLSAALDQDPARFDVTYDPELGYPRSAFIDFDERVADEEQGFTARDMLF